jgi:hypothetical protein
MNEPRLDALLRAFVGPRPTRRVGLRCLATSALGSAFGVLRFHVAGETTAARCARAGKACGDGKNCCKGTRCVKRRCQCKRGVLCGGKCCLGDLTCQSGSCVCPAGERECSPRACEGCCANADCGTGGKTCQNGTCACPPGQRDCNGTCQECCDTPDCRPDQQCDFFGACVCPGQTRECDGRCIQAACCSNADCGGAEQCVGGVCRVPPAVCPPNPNNCAGVVSCQGSGQVCYCVTTTAGAVGCRGTVGFQCQGCATDADCVEHGLGWMCISQPCSCPPPQTACVPPCPNPA